MPAPLDVDREAVKAHAQTHGLIAAATAFGLAVGTVKAWSGRDPQGPWISSLMVKPKLPPSVAPVQPATLRTASEAAQLQLQTNSEQTKLGFAQAYATAATEAAGMTGNEVLERAGQLKAAVDGADKIHGWSAQGREASTVVNLAFIQNNG